MFHDKSLRSRAAYARPLKISRSSCGQPRIRRDRAFQFTCPTSPRQIPARRHERNLFPIKGAAPRVDRFELRGRLHYGGLTLRLICESFLAGEARGTAGGRELQQRIRNSSGSAGTTRPTPAVVSAPSLIIRLKPRRG